MTDPDARARTTAHEVRDFLRAHIGRAVYVEQTTRGRYPEVVGVVEHVGDETATIRTLHKGRGRLVVLASVTRVQEYETHDRPSRNPTHA